MICFTDAEEDGNEDEKGGDDYNDDFADDEGGDEEEQAGDSEGMSPLCYTSMLLIASLVTSLVRIDRLRMGHVNSLHAMQFQTGIRSQNLIYATIDCVYLGIP